MWWEHLRGMQGSLTSPVKTQVPEPRPTAPVSAPHSTANRPLCTSCVCACMWLCPCLCMCVFAKELSAQSTGSTLTEGLPQTRINVAPEYKNKPAITLITRTQYQTISAFTHFNQRFDSATLKVIIFQMNQGQSTWNSKQLFPLNEEDSVLTYGFLRLETPH